MRYGVSKVDRLVMGRPAAAARLASAPPDDCPWTPAEPPFALITAAMSSISRSTAYGVVSPLSPRPRRS
jgi:hypothetical protein